MCMRKNGAAARGEEGGGGEREVTGSLGIGRECTVNVVGNESKTSSDSKEAVSSKQAK